MIKITTGKLSKREKQCLYWAAKDLSLKQTADALTLSDETVKRYRRSVLRKLNCQTMAGALFVAIEQGLIQH